MRGAVSPLIGKSSGSPCETSGQRWSKPRCRYRVMRSAPGPRARSLVRFDCASRSTTARAGRQTAASSSKRSSRRPRRPGGPSMRVQQRDPPPRPLGLSPARAEVARSVARPPASAQAARRAPIDADSDAAGTAFAGNTAAGKRGLMLSANAIARPGRAETIQIVGGRRNIGVVCRV
jgi:hypothetical protein